MEISYNITHPGYLSFIPSGGLFPSAVSELICCSMNRYTGYVFACPGLVSLESNVLIWFCKIIGYSKSSFGFYTEGATSATMNAICLARNEKIKEKFYQGVIYTSEQSHFSVKKSAKILGFPLKNLRMIKTNKNFEMSIEHLKETIEIDKNNGNIPFMVIGTAGTTNTGSVDDFEEISKICKKENLWFHVDGAYGGFFKMTERGKTALKCIEEADSVVLDPHKSLMLPFGLGCLLVKEAICLKRLYSVLEDENETIEYIPNATNERFDFANCAPDSTKSAKGIRAWLPIKLFGMSAFKNCLDEKLDLTEFLLEELKKMKEIEILSTCPLTVINFRYNNGENEEELDKKNKSIIDFISKEQKVMVVNTTLNGVFSIRVCILHHRTSKSIIEILLELLKKSISNLE
jgi:aromatic-L-amino-acid/L-tryptophan decarboxylase